MAKEVLRRWKETGVMQTVNEKGKIEINLTVLE
jgi:ribosomal protein S25